MRHDLSISWIKAQTGSTTRDSLGNASADEQVARPGPQACPLPPITQRSSYPQPRGHLRLSVLGPVESLGPVVPVTPRQLSFFPLCLARVRAPPPSALLPLCLILPLRHWGYGCWLTSGSECSHYEFSTPRSQGLPVVLHGELFLSMGEERNSISPIC